MRLNRRRFGQAALTAAMLPRAFADAAENGGGAPQSSRTWFRDARFGMFIHFGLYATLERGEWVMHREAIPPAEYQKLISRFDPKEFDARAWSRSPGRPASGT